MTYINPGIFFFMLVSGKAYRVSKEVSQQEISAELSLYRAVTSAWASPASKTSVWMSVGYCMPQEFTQDTC